MRGSQITALITLGRRHRFQWNVVVHKLGSFLLKPVDADCKQRRAKHDHKSAQEHLKFGQDHRDEIHEGQQIWRHTVLVLQSNGVILDISVSFEL